MNSEEVKETARKFGADLVGIAPIERFKQLPKEKHPASIFPECKSVVVVGRRILRGSLRGVEEGTNFGSTYGCFGLHYIEDNFLSQTIYDLNSWIEEQKFEAVPLFGFNSDVGFPKGVPVVPEKPAPNVIVDLDFAAQAAGVAEIGLGGFPLSPEYGPRQRFALLLTDAELGPDPVADFNICGNCGVCAQACPLQAINPEKISKTGVSGHEKDLAEINFSRCRQCQNGAAFPRGREGQPDRLAAACVRACVVQLEKNKKCSNSFTNKFRKRKPWALDSLGNPVIEKTEDTSKLGCAGGTQRV